MREKNYIVNYFVYDKENDTYCPEDCHVKNLITDRKDITDISERNKKIREEVLKSPLKYTIKKDEEVLVRSKTKFASDVFKANTYIIPYARKCRIRNLPTEKRYAEDYDFVVTIVEETEDAYIFTKRFVPAEINGNYLGEPCIAIAEDELVECNLNCDKCHFNFTKKRNNPFSKIKHVATRL